MRNFVSRIPLGENKWAYEQAPEFAESAERHLRRIRRLWKPPGYFYHLRSGGHIAAVQSHLRNRVFAKIDLSRFFERVTRNRIIKRLCALGIDADEATDFAITSTVWRYGRTEDGRKQFVLPYGFVQSALLASLDLDKSRLGREISSLSELGLTLSVYVDDIVVSGIVENQVEAAFGKLVDAADVAGFPINEEKCVSVQDRMRAFNIDFAYDQMEVAADRMREFEVDVMTALDDDRKTAIVAYVKSVNIAQARRFFETFNRHLGCASHLFEN